jgi:predicted ATPase with chaperone activity
MLARRLTTILPAMTLPEAIETTRIHRVAGHTARPTIRPTIAETVILPHSARTRVVVGKSSERSIL